MHSAVELMLAKFACETTGDYVNALREILQELALLGLWRAKFFEHAAFYGGTALRILYDLDRFSEDLDFSLLEPQEDFRLDVYADSLQKEIAAFGFEVEFETRKRRSAIDSAFLKTNTYEQLINIRVGKNLLSDFHQRRLLKIKLEVDTDPPPKFQTEMRYLLNPIPFAVRSYSLPDLFAGKMHAILCRNWKNRVKGRDWYDLVWYISNHPQLNLEHLEERMRHSGDYQNDLKLSLEALLELLHEKIDDVNLEQAKSEVQPFLRNPETVAIWSKEFFHQVIERIEAD